MVDRVDQRQPLAELASAADELEVVALLELAARSAITGSAGALQKAAARRRRAAAG
jgi:hypothetical protein